MVNVASNPDVDYYYVHDHLYSPVALLASDGTVAERYEYNAYGKCYVHTDDGDDNIWLTADDTPANSSARGNPYAFTGRTLDKLSGSLEILYYRNRYYSTNIGRWLSNDPLGIVPNGYMANKKFSPTDQYKDDLNLYEYVRSNPAISMDPMGLYDCLRTYLHYLSRGGDVVVTNPDSDIVQEVRGLPDLKEMGQDLKDQAEHALRTHGKKMSCPVSFDMWSPPARNGMTTVPFSSIGLRLALQTFSYSAQVSCMFIKLCCSKEHGECTGLPAPPCGLVAGVCSINWHAWDTYDFKWYDFPYGYIGEPYDIDMLWSEDFFVGPVTVCP